MLFISNVEPSKLKTASRSIVMLTGDGRWEDRLVEGFCKKFDGGYGGKSVISLRGPIVGRITGIASLSQIKILIGKFGVRDFIWLCDKEHFERIDGWENRIMDALRVYGINAVIGESYDGYAKFYLEFGGKRAIVWAALVGVERKLEENLVKLIKMQYEKKIEPTKDELRNFLKKHGMDVETLIEKSAMDNLRESFPSVFTVFEKIHDDP